MARDSCLSQVTAGAAIGGAVGGAFGAVWGTVNLATEKMPGLLKIRYIGQTTLKTGGLFGIVLAAGCLIRCGRSY